MTTDAQIVCLMSHYLKALVSLEGPVHTSAEAEKQCPMCQEAKE